MAIVTYNDNGTIKVVKFGNYVVSTDADPVVEKYWKFMNGTSDIRLMTTYDVIGVQETTYKNEGCASHIQLATGLTSLSHPSGLAIGTKAAIRMNSMGGVNNCNTWAVFEVREV